MFKNILALLFTSLLIACSGSPKVQRIDASSSTDLSGSWNDTDSRLVSKEMIKDVLSRPWISDFVRTESHRPAIIVGTIRNKSHEHINVETFISDIERELINSGKADFVASKEERAEVRDERKEQALNASDETRNEMGYELGADFMLKGQINTIFDTIEDAQVRYYQVDLTLINLANNRKVWLGQKKIKKSIKGSKIRP